MRLFYLSSHFLEARAEIGEQFCWFFEGNEDKSLISTLILEPVTLSNTEENCSLRIN